jgi:hypothetical protein
MDTNNLKTFNASNLAESCGYEDVIDLLGPGGATFLAGLDVGDIQGLFSQAGVELVAS